ncbi:MAG TPA: ATP-binding protein [Candidatus Acidoferrales bacterium]|nr:ATP-binding protein [Candidatus Acidoferrales bacterium]
MPSGRKRQWWPIVGGIIVVLLAAAVITLGSFRSPLQPGQRGAFSVFFALSTLIAVALLIFALVLTRSLVRLWAERRSGQLGSRFKVKMVLGAMGVSLAPVVFLFFYSYAVVNRTLNLWFPRPLETANEQSQILLTNFGQSEFERLNGLALQAASHGGLDENFLSIGNAADAYWIADASGRVTLGAKLAGPSGAERTPAGRLNQKLETLAPKFVQAIGSGAQVWRANGQLYLAGSAPWKGGNLYVAGRLPDEFLDRYSEIETQTKTYLEQKQQLRAYKRNLVAALMLITLVLLFTTTWVALFLSKQVTVPIQALAEATREISQGNFDHRIEVQAQDELGTLVRSFNRMTEQLGEGRRQINEFTQSLEQAIEEREHRRKLMEAVLENIPTGVISLDASGEIARANTAVVAILGESARNAHTLPELVGEEAARTVLHLMRRSLRMGAASREIEIATGGRLVRTAVTVSSLGPRRSNPGFIVVIDDLTDLLRAQKAAAWQEVAQRIAHEIKNPLTPIQLSAQRLLRHLERAATANPAEARSEFEKLAAECAGLIEREVETLESLVDEFSQFARFPAARLAPASVNSIVESALGLFQGRLDGISVSTELASSLPPVKADPELMRQVVANLIDNAAEAMEGSAIRRLHVATRAEGDGDAVEIEVADSGHGIPPADKERLFLPHFSTKGRGTGLGLAIANRIIAEHNGTIRVEDNFPAGARFVIRFPAAEIAMPTQAG